MLRIAVIGIGNQGRHHLRFLSQLNRVVVSLLVDRDPEKVASADAEFHLPAYTSYGGHLNEFDAAIIAVPTSDHFEIAMDLLRAGKHVLIEKPVTSTVEQANRLNEEAVKQSLVAHVGFPERF